MNRPATLVGGDSHPDLAGGSGNPSRCARPRPRRRQDARAFHDAPGGIPQGQHGRSYYRLQRHELPGISTGKDPGDPVQRFDSRNPPGLRPRVRQENHGAAGPGRLSRRPASGTGSAGAEGEVSEVPGPFRPRFFPRIPPKLEAERAVLQGRSSEFPVRVASSANCAAQSQSLGAAAAGTRALAEGRDSPRTCLEPGNEPRYRVLVREGQGPYEPIFLNLLADSDPTVRVETAIACGGAHVKGVARTSCGCSTRTWA